MITRVGEAGEAGRRQGGRQELGSCFRAHDDRIVDEGVPQKGRGIILLEVTLQILDIHFRSAAHNVSNIARQRSGMNQIAFDFIASPAKPLESVSRNLRRLDTQVGVAVHKF